MRPGVAANDLLPVVYDALTARLEDDEHDPAAIDTAFVKALDDGGVWVRVRLRPPRGRHRIVVAYTLTVAEVVGPASESTGPRARREVLQDPARRA